MVEKKSRKSPREYHLRGTVHLKKKATDGGVQQHGGRTIIRGESHTGEAWQLNLTMTMRCSSKDRAKVCQRERVKKSKSFVGQYLKIKKALRDVSKLRIRILHPSYEAC